MNQVGEEPLRNLAELIQRFLDSLEVERNASPYTVRNYRRDLGDFAAFLQEAKVAFLENVDRQVLRNYLAWLMERGLVKASIARKLSTLRSFYRFLVREGVVTTNPLSGLSSPKVEKRLPGFLSPEEAVCLLLAPNPETPQGLRDRAILELLYASGLRVSEIAGLNVSQVSLLQGELQVWGKGSKERLALMGKPAVSALEAYLHRGRPQLLGERQNRALFVNRRGTRLTPRFIQRILAQYSRAASLGKRVHPHMLRHTFATHLLDGGADLRAVQELLGHASLSSTQIYTHVTQSQARRVYLASHPRARKERRS